MPTSKIARFAFMLLFILVLSLQGIQPAAAKTGSVRTKTHPQTGKLSFIGTDPGAPIKVSGAEAPGLSQEDRARAMIEPYAADLGLKHARGELKVTHTRSLSGRQTTKFQQTYQDIPVMAGELVVNADDQGGLLSINGELSPDLGVDTKPAVNSEQAKETALEALAKAHKGKPSDFKATQPELWIYDPRLLQPDGTPPRLVWRMDVTDKADTLALRELVLVDAQRGNIALEFNQVETVFKAPPAGQPSEAPAAPLTIGSPVVQTYNMGNATSPLPGTFVCDLSYTNCTNGVDLQADKAELYAYGMDQFYRSHFGRNGLDNANMTIKSSVHYGSGYDNAAWQSGQMIYGDAHAFSYADDVVGHELTHGVGDYEANFFYYYQSGAIDESMSDVFGELYDQSNGLGTDTPAVKWLIGEDIPGLGAGRSMSNPPLYGDPDKMSSPNYYLDPNFTDNGGVHYNSGIGNKAAYLMTDGGTFNGQTVTGLGANKVLGIYYEAYTNLLTSGSDYGDLYVDLYQACINRVGLAEAITMLDCQSVRRATDAVEMNGVPAAGYSSEAAKCNPGEIPVNVFSDNLESGSGNWSMYAYTGTSRWRYDPPAGWSMAHSGIHSLYADDYPAAVTDTVLETTNGITLPTGANLYFHHAYDLEWYPGDPLFYDGGVVEYSDDNGAHWWDTATMMSGGGYDGGIATGFGNPLAGRPAFVGTSHGYTSTRLILNFLAGHTVKFRWRLGLDDFGYSLGWWLDDISIYTCQLAPIITGSAGIPNAMLTYFDGGPKIVTADGSGFYTFTVTPNWSGTVTPAMPHYAFVPPSRSYSNVTSNWIGQNYTAVSGIDVSVANVLQGTYNPYSGGSTSSNYPNLMSGPVQVKAPGNAFASQVVASGGSYNEIMGYPVNQFTTDYWFPFYDHGYPSVPGNNMRTWILVGNPSTTNTATVHITIGGTEMAGSPFTILPGANVTPRWIGTINGPVHVSSNINVFASERVFTVPYNSFNEMMGFPATQFTTEYWFPWYDDINMTTYIKVGNTSSSVTANVDIYVGATKEGSYTIPHDQTITQIYPATMDGPVRVVSTNGVNIVASEWTLSGTTNSFNEVMGYPFNRFTTEYFFPWYDHGYPSVPGNSMRTWILVGNPSATLTASVNIYIDNVLQTGSPFLVAPGSRVTPRWMGTIAGAVRVSSDLPVFTSERVFTVPSNSFNEMMGYPGSQITNEYWFPWYDSINMPNSLWVSRP